MTRIVTLLAGILFCIVSFEAFGQSSRLIAYKKIYVPQAVDSVRFTYSFGRGGDLNDYNNNILKYDTLYDMDVISGNFYPGTKIVHSFNQQDLVTETHTIASTGSYLARDLNEYDLNNNLTLTTTQNWTGSWENYYKYPKTYDVNNNLLSREKLVWNGGAWQPQIKTLFTYDINNNQTSELNLFYSQITSQYDSVTLFTYHYTGGVHDTTWVRNWGANSLIRHVYVYSGGLNASINSYIWDMNSWMPYARTFKSYYGVNNLFAGDSIQRWDSNTWNDSLLKKYRFDSNDDMVSILHKFPNTTTGILENVSLDTMTYNNYHQVTWSKQLGWDGNSGTFISVAGAAEFYYYYQEFNSSNISETGMNTVKVKMFPSPAYDNISLSANFDTPEDFKVQIYDMQGRLVLQVGEKATKDYSRKIQLNNLPSGNYIMQLKGSRTNFQQQFSILK